MRHSHSVILFFHFLCPRTGMEQQLNTQWPHALQRGHRSQERQRSGLIRSPEHSSCRDGFALLTFCTISFVAVHVSSLLLSITMAGSETPAVLNVCVHYLCSFFVQCVHN